MVGATSPGPTPSLGCEVVGACDNAVDTIDGGGAIVAVTMECAALWFIVEG